MDSTMKYLAIVCTVLSCFCIILWSWAQSERKQKIEAEASLKVCIKEKERYNEKDMAASKTIAELRKMATKHHSMDCDCYNLPVPDDIVKLVQEQRRKWNKK